MRTVLATSHTPTLDSGRARRTFGLVRALAALGPVDLVYGAFGATDPDPAFEQLSGVRLHRVDRPGRFRRVAAYLPARASGVPDDFARGIWPQVASTSVQLAGNGEGVRVVAEGPIAAAALLPYAKRHPAVYSAHNLESSFRHRLTDTAMSLGSLQRFERLLLERYAESWMVSPADMKGAAALAPSARLRLVPNVVDVAAIDPVSPRQGQETALFVADLSYEPNRDALRFLLDSAMPALWARAPELRLAVAGKGSEAIEADDRRAQGLGFVPDLRALYDSAGCAVVPLLEGGGSPLKFVEALAFGVPVVATPLAAAGLEVEAGVHYVEADADGESFAQGMLAALEPERGNELATAGRRLAEREYSIESLERRLTP
jgi:polysaccharide biosynthesis protein PslH